MFKPRVLMLLATVVVLAARPVYGQAPTLEAGSKSVSINGFLVHVSGDTLFMVGGEYGIFTSPQLEVGPRVTLAVASGDGSDHAIMIGGFVRYRAVSQTNTIPYLTLGANYVFGSGGLGEGVIQGGAGLDFFVSEKSSFYVELQAVKILESGVPTAVVSTIGMRLFF